MYVHAPGKRLDNWFTRLFKLVAYKPLCGRLGAGDTVREGRAGDKPTCPACVKTLEALAREAL